LTKLFVFPLLVLTYFPVLAQVSPFPDRVLGFRDFSRQAKIDQDFLAVPDPRLAQEELKTLTAVPHVAASKEDYDTALYVASKFKAAGLETQILAESSSGGFSRGQEHRRQSAVYGTHPGTCRQ
jgi:N-acetylated-alpha-linked acidic dipeptidase